MKKIFVALFPTRENRKFVLWGIVVLLAVILIAVMIFSSVECFFMSLTGIKNKPELIKLIGWGISGLVAILGVMGLLQRATALDEQNKMTEESHIQERFNKATEHLGHASMSVRIAAFNAFCHLVEIKPDWRKTIFDILCAHLRQTTKNKNYQKKEEVSEAKKTTEIKLTEKVSEAKKTTEIKPTEEVQSLLKILFIDNLIFSDMVADLEGVHLQSANLQGANLQGANLQDAILRDANLQGANLQGANLEDAILRDANLQRANLQGANLEWAKLEWANLQEANLEKAEMKDISLQNAELQKAMMKKAYMRWANLQNADFQGANLQDANLREAKLQGAFMREAILQKAFMLESKINKKTIMPDGWEDMVERNEDGKTGILHVDDEGKIIEYL